MEGCIVLFGVGNERVGVQVCSASWPLGSCQVTVEVFFLTESTENTEWTLRLGFFNRKGREGGRKGH
jgi:hypothetical protein